MRDLAQVLDHRQPLPHLSCRNEVLVQKTRFRTPCSKNMTRRTWLKEPDSKNLPHWAGMTLQFVRPDIRQSCILLAAVRS
jgi:hypothetical protein